MRDMKEDKRIRYPAINIYTSPRYFQQKIDHTSRPLAIYSGPVEANNVTRYYDQKAPDLSFLRKVDIADGMLWQFSEMNTRLVDVG